MDTSIPTSAYPFIKWPPFVGRNRISRHSVELLFDLSYLTLFDLRTWIIAEIELYLCRNFVGSLSGLRVATNVVGVCLPVRLTFAPTPLLRTNGLRNEESLS